VCVCVCVCDVICVCVMCVCVCVCMCVCRFVRTSTSPGDLSAKCANERMAPNLKGETKQQSRKITYKKKISKFHTTFAAAAQTNQMVDFIIL